MRYTVAELEHLYWRRHAVANLINSGMTMKEIAKLLRLSPPRIAQMRDQARQEKLQRKRSPMEREINDGPEVWIMAQIMMRSPFGRNELHKNAFLSRHDFSRQDL